MYVNYLDCMDCEMCGNILNDIYFVLWIGYII